MQQEHFFQSFFGNQTQPNIQTVPEYILHNEIVNEIVNNWMYVIDLMHRHREGKLKQVDQLEHVWYNFITANNIDITQYKNENDFLDAWWKDSAI